MAVGRDSPAVSVVVPSADSGRGAPGKLAMDELMSWSDHSENGVKYFSGSATYRISLDVPQELCKASATGAGFSSKVYLDLGRVAVMTSSCSFQNGNNSRS